MIFIEGTNSAVYSVQKLQHLTLEGFGEFLDNSEDVITQQLKKQMKELLLTESTGTDLESTLSEYVSIQTSELRAKGRFPASLDSSLYESKAEEEIKKLVSGGQGLNSANLMSVWEQSKQIYKEYLIALADDVKTGKIQVIDISNGIGDALEDFVSKENFN